MTSEGWIRSKFLPTTASVEHQSDWTKELKDVAGCDLALAVYKKQQKTPD